MISYILKTGKAIGPHLQRGTLVVLESTTFPGTTEEDLRRVLEEHSGLGRGGFPFAFSPEREDPGNDKSKVKTVPKVVGGYTRPVCDRAMELYRLAVDTVIPVSSVESPKQPNSRKTFFACEHRIVNELKLVYGAMGSIFGRLSPRRRLILSGLCLLSRTGFGRTLHPD